MTVIGITFGAAYLREEIAFATLLVLVGSNYLYKLVAALLDTGPMYLATAVLSRYLRIDPTREHRGWEGGEVNAGDAGRSPRGSGSSSPH